jgi:hypothetical protein
MQAWRVQSAMLDQHLVVALSQGLAGIIIPAADPIVVL